MGQKKVSQDMKMYNDCIPCIVRGSLDAARLATDDEALQQKIVKAVMARLVEEKMDCPPPMMARHTPSRWSDH